VRGPLGGVVDGGSLDDGSPSWESQFFALVDSVTVYLTIILLTVEDLAFASGGGA
jgi:hypothetical protein